MSQLLNGLTFPLSVEQLNPAYVHAGIPFTASSAVAYENLAPIDHYHQGLPFTSGGRLCAELNGTVDSVQPGGIPITAAGLIAFGTGAIDHYSGGVAYTATNQIAVV